MLVHRFEVTGHGIWKCIAGGDQSFEVGSFQPLFNVHLQIPQPKLIHLMVLFPVALGINMRISISGGHIRN